MRTLGLFSSAPYGYSYSTKAVDFTKAYAIKISEQWHSAVKVQDLGDYLDVQVGSHQSIQCRKHAVTAIKVVHPVDTHVGQQRKFDLEVA